MTKFALAMALSVFAASAFPRPLDAKEITGEIVSVDLDVRTMNVMTRNPFTKKEFPERLVWVAKSPEAAALQELKPGSRVRVRVDKDPFGRYLVKKVVRAE